MTGRGAARALVRLGAVAALVGVVGATPAYACEVAPPTIYPCGPGGSELCMRPADFRGAIDCVRDLLP